MQPIIPDKLKKSDEVRIVTPSRSMAILSEHTKKIANQRFDELGLEVSFGRHVMNCDAFDSSKVK